jgi:hypothetical protein
METANNSILNGSFLGSKYFNPIYLFNQVYGFLHNLFSFGVTTEARNVFYAILFIFATFFLAVIFYSLVRVLEIRKKEQAYLEYEIAEYAHHKKEEEKKKQESMEVSENARWVKTLTYLFSDSSSDWKLAIIEADAMLDTLMGELGFKGANLGERLKGADQDRFRNLTIAWEVHAIRNRIAHEGLAFEISAHEAKRVIALYEKIFREYGYI